MIDSMHIVGFFELVMKKTLRLLAQRPNPASFVLVVQDRTCVRVEVFAFVWSDVTLNTEHSRLKDKNIKALNISHIST